MAKLPFSQLRKQKKNRWVSTPQGAKPVDPASRRTMRRGTAKMKANRGSEKLNRLIRSAFFAALQVMALIVISTGFFAVLWEFYDKVPWGKAMLQGIGSVVVVMVWLVFARERVKHEQHVAQQHERDFELARAEQEDVGGRTARLASVDPSRPPKDVRSTWEQEFDQRPDWDKPV